MKNFKTNCIMCPLGCELDVKTDSKNIMVTGNTCPRGEAYIKTELTAPVRNISSLVQAGDVVVPVKTTAPVPKSKIQAILDELSKIKLDKVPEFGTVIVKNILGLDVDIVSIGF